MSKTAYDDIFESLTEATVSFKKGEYLGWLGFTAEALILSALYALLIVFLLHFCLASLFFVPVISLYSKVKKKINATKQ